MSDETRTTYRVIQKGTTVNVPVSDFESLVTHHPGDNNNAVMVDGTIIRGEPGRLHAYLDGEIQEVEIARNGKNYGLKPDQVLLKKDFILEHPSHPTLSAEARKVDVPSPIAGYVGRVDEAQGLVDIYDNHGGDVIARIRHMRGIAVSEGQTIEYGQSLGTQSDVKTGAKHVHLEMDTRYFQQYENYIADLVSGRLPIEAAQRLGVQPVTVVDDGTFRLGESNDRIRHLQQVMGHEGYRAADDRPLVQDGVYRLDMQGALLDFQRVHGLPQTGDIDPATLRMAPVVQRREVGRNDNFRLGQSMPTDPAQVSTAPGHPDHPDHRQSLTNPLPPPVNQPAPAHRRSSPADSHHPDHAMLETIRDGVRKIDESIGKPFDDSSERLSRSLLVACKESGLRRVDHVVMGLNSTNLFAVEGGMHNPAHTRVHVAVEQAIRTPVEQSDDKLLIVNQTLSRDVARQQDLARNQEDPSQSGPRFTM